MFRCSECGYILDDLTVGLLQGKCFGDCIGVLAPVDCPATSDEKYFAVEPELVLRVQSEFPYPLARDFGRMETEGNLQSRLYDFLLGTLLYQVPRFLALLLLCDYLNRCCDGTLTPCNTVNQFIWKVVTSAQIGTWLGLTREILRYMAEESIEPFVRELHGLLPGLTGDRHAARPTDDEEHPADEAATIMTALGTERNRVAHLTEGLGHLSEGQKQRRSVELRFEFYRVIRTLSYLTEYSMLMKQGGSWFALRGCKPGPLSVTPEIGRLEDGLFLARIPIQGMEFLNLNPLVLCRKCDEAPCSGQPAPLKGEEVFVFGGLAGSGRKKVTLHGIHPQSISDASLRESVDNLIAAAEITTHMESPRSREPERAT